jgi:hypothetical protein
VSVFQTLFRVTSVLFLVAAGVLFLRQIALAYRTEGPSYPDRNRGYAVRSAALLLAWLGAVGLAAARRAGRALLDTLYEASADLGEWYVSRRGLDIDSNSRPHSL